MKWLDGFLTALLIVFVCLAILFAIQTKDEIDKLMSNFKYIESRCDSARDVNNEQWRHIRDIRKKCGIEDPEERRGWLNSSDGWYSATP